MSVVVAAVILLVCVLGVIAGRLATGGGDDGGKPASDTPATTGEEPEPEPETIAMPDLVGENAADALIVLSCSKKK